MNYTPGPWKVLTEGDEDFTTRTIIAENCGARNLSEVCLMTTGSFNDPTEDANARLISAAPDLFMSLQKLLKYLDDQILVRNIEKDSEPGFEIRMLPFVMDLEEAVKAIRKATNEPKPKKK